VTQNLFLEDPLHPHTPHYARLRKAGMETNGDLYELGWELLLERVSGLTEAEAQEIYDWSDDRPRPTDATNMLHTDGSLRYDDF
jgi:hypothetical protein